MTSQIRTSCDFVARDWMASLAVKKDGTSVATYTYDANGNRLNGGSAYDEEDQKLTGDGATSTYTPNAVDGTKVNMPDYFERGGTTYAVSTDQLGSAPTDVHPV